MRGGEEAALVEEKEELVTVEDNSVPRVVNSPTVPVDASAVVFMAQEWKQVLRAVVCLPDTNS